LVHWQVTDEIGSSEIDIDTRSSSKERTTNAVAARRDSSTSSSYGTYDSAKPLVMMMTSALTCSDADAAAIAMIAHDAQREHLERQRRELHHEVLE
jgi:hypothetical protein